MSGLAGKALDKSWQVAHKYYTRVRDSNKLLFGLAALYLSAPIASAFAEQAADHGDHHSSHSSVPMGDAHFPVLGCTEASNDAVNLVVELWPGQKCYFDSFPKELLKNKIGTQSNVSRDSAAPADSNDTFHAKNNAATIKGICSDLKKEARKALVHEKTLQWRPYPIAMGTYHPFIGYNHDKKTHEMNLKVNLGRSPWLYAQDPKIIDAEIPPITVCGEPTPEAMLVAKDVYLFCKFYLSPSLLSYLHGGDIRVGDTMAAADPKGTTTGGRLNNFYTGRYNWAINRIVMPASKYYGTDPEGGQSKIHGAVNASDWRLLNEKTTKFNLLHELGHKFCDYSGIYSHTDPENAINEAFYEDMAKLEPAQLEMVDPYFLTSVEASAEIMATLLYPDKHPHGVLQLMFPATTSVLINTLIKEGVSQNLNIYIAEDFDLKKEESPNSELNCGIHTNRENVPGSALNIKEEAIKIGNTSVVGNNTVLSGPIDLGEGNKLDSGLFIVGEDLPEGFKADSNNVFVSEIHAVGPCISVPLTDISNSSNKVYVVGSDVMLVPVKPFDRCRAVAQVENNLGLAPGRPDAAKSHSSVAEATCK